MKLSKSTAEHPLGLPCDAHPIQAWCRRSTVGATLWVLLCLLLVAGVAETHHIRIEDHEFAPKAITIAPGDTIVWTNFGTDHTVTADGGFFNSSAGGAAALEFGETFTHTFPEAGQFPYHCVLHGAPGGQDMAGSVRVLVPGANVLPATPLNVAPAAGATNQTTAPLFSASAFSDADEGDIHAASRWIIRDAQNDVVFDSLEDAENLTTLALTGLSFGATYNWQVSYKDDRGGWSAYSAATSFTTVTNLPQNGAGLRGTYALYNLKRNLVTVRTVQTDPVIDFNWGLGKPSRLIPANNFFVRWEGTVVPEFSETYRIRIKGDGGVRLWINDQLIIEDWVVCRFAVYRSATVALQASVPATIKIEYFDTTGAASVNLRWSSASQPLQLIPQARLFPPPQ